MKEQIIIYFNKDIRHPNDYLIKRVLSPVGDNYTIISYYKIFGEVKRFTGKTELNTNLVCKYVLQCRKSKFFNRIEYQNIMGV